MPHRFGRLRGSVSGVALLAALLLGLGCTRDEPTPAAAPKPVAASAPARAAPAPALLLASADAGGTAWFVEDAAGGPGRAVGKSAGAASLWALDDPQGAFYARSGDGVWRGAWRVPDAPMQRMAGLPGTIGEVQAAWIDASTGGLRALEMRQPTAGEARSMSREPPDARPYWALLWRLQDGAWKTLERRATSWGVDGSVGPAIFDDLRRERGRSARGADDAASCVALCDDTVEAPAGIDPGPAEEWRSLPGSAGRVVFGVALGDRWHPVGPVVLLQPGQGPRSVAAAQAQGLRLQRHGDWLLVTSAELPAKPRLVDLRDGSTRDLRETVTQPVWVD